jgi:hypothetical protein
MVLHEGRNDQLDSGMEFLSLALMPMGFDESFPDANGYTDDRVFSTPYFMFGDSDEDDEDDMEDDDFDDNDFDDDVDDFDDEKDDFNFMKDDDDDDDDDDYDDDDYDDDDYDDDE